MKQLETFSPFRCAPAFFAGYGEAALTLFLQSLATETAAVSGRQPGVCATCFPLRNVRTTTKAEAAFAADSVAASNKHKGHFCAKAEAYRDKGQTNQLRFIQS